MLSFRQFVQRPLDTAGTAIYELSTGKLKERRPIPASLPGISGFETLLLSNGFDYVYWMYFPPKIAILAAGLAYHVKDGVPLSLCDPEWEQEHNDNYITALKRYAWAGSARFYFLQVLSRRALIPPDMFTTSSKPSWLSL